MLLWRRLAWFFLLIAGPVAHAEERPDPNTLLTGALLAEGSPWDSPGTFKLDDIDKSLTLDLQREWTIRGLLLQADGDDIYFVEGCDDGVSWKALWRVPRFSGVPGLRTRTTVLAQAVRVRYVRIRPTLGDGAFAVSRFRIYESLPSPWPPALDESRSQLPLFPGLSADLLIQLRHGIAGLALAVLAWTAASRKDPIPRRGQRGVLGLVTLLSVLSFWNFLNFHHYSGLVHLQDAYHYFVGAKYFPEIGYTGLYECSAVAEVDDGRVEQVRERQLRDLATNLVIPARAIAVHGERCRAAFSAERWEAFRRDVRFFRDAMGDDAWLKSQLDHGFNATPVWILAGGRLANLAVASRASLVILSLIDILLLFVAWGLMRWAFGFEPACVATIFFCVNAFSRFAWTGGALLRYDWLLWAVAGVCFLRKERGLAAGAALGYSTALRIFPAFLLLGLAAGPLGRAVWHRSLTPLVRYRAIAIGLLLALVILIPLSVTATGHPRAWTEFADNTRRFLTTDAENLVGLPVLAAYQPSLRQEMTFDPLETDPLSEWSRSQAAARTRSVPLVVGLGLAYLAFLMWASFRQQDWVNAILGMGLVAILLRAANYYYSWLLLFGLLSEVSPGAGVGLAGLAWASDLAASAWPRYDERAVALSALAVVFVVAVMIRFAVRPHARPSDGGP
jgi:hypothetical protein